jgi:hypothetical protein
MKRGKSPETLTAERIAVLLEAPETPPAVRDLLCVACLSVDEAASTYDAARDACEFIFESGDEVTPALVRRHLPEMLRKVGHYRAADWIAHGLTEPMKKRGC